MKSFSTIGGGTANTIHGWDGPAEQKVASLLQERADDPVIYDAENGKVSYKAGRPAAVLGGDNCRLRGVTEGITIWRGQDLVVEADEEVVRISALQKWVAFPKA